jgi:hypothetical protein
MVAGTVAGLELAVSFRLPLDPRAPDTLRWMYSARRWSVRSTSANGGPGCTDDRDGAAQGPCLCASRSTADVPLISCRGAIAETAKNSRQETQPLSSKATSH